MPRPPGNPPKKINKIAAPIAEPLDLQAVHGLWELGPVIVWHEGTKMKPAGGYVGRVTGIFRRKNKDKREYHVVYPNLRRTQIVEWDDVYATPEEFFDDNSSGQLFFAARENDPKWRDAEEYLGKYIGNVIRPKKKKSMRKKSKGRVKNVGELGPARVESRNPDDPLVSPIQGTEIVTAESVIQEKSAQPIPVTPPAESDVEQIENYAHTEDAPAESEVLIRALSVAPNPTPAASPTHEIQVETSSSPLPKRTEQVFAKKTQPPTPSPEDDPRAPRFKDGSDRDDNEHFTLEITEVEVQQGGETLKSILTDVVDEVVRGFMQSCRKTLGSKTDPLYNIQNSEHLPLFIRIWEATKLVMGSLHEVEIKGLVDGYQKWASVEAFRYANATMYEELVSSGKLNPHTDPEAVKYNITRCYFCEDEFGYHKLSDKGKARSDYLLNHARRYHVAGKGSFHCEQCSDSFWTKGQLTAHIKSTHGESGAARRAKARVGMQNLRETRRKGLNVHIKSTQGKSGETRREGPQKRRTRKHPPVHPLLLIDDNKPRNAKPPNDFDWTKAEEVWNAAEPEPREPESDDPDFVGGTVQSKRRMVKVKLGTKPEASSDTSDETSDDSSDGMSEKPENWNPENYFEN